MVNRKGFLRILEASIAIILIISVLIVLLGRSEQRTMPDLGEVISPIIEEMSKNQELRSNVLDYSSQDDAGKEQIILDLKEFVEQKIGNNPTIDFDVRICESDDVCSLEEFPSNNADGNIYTRSRIISTNPDSAFVGKAKLKLFIWRISPS